MFEEAYKLGSTRSQVLKGAIELGLPPRRTRHDFLEHTKERKRLGHERNEPGKTCLEGQRLENTRIWTLWGKSVSRASDYPRSTNRATIDLEGAQIRQST